MSKLWTTRQPMGNVPFVATRYPGSSFLQPIPHRQIPAASKDWRSYVEMQGLRDTGAIISIGDYLLSLGAHGLHACLLMDDGRSAPLTVEKTFEIAALLSYVFRCPIVPRHWTSVKKEQLAVNRRAFEKNLPGFSLDEYTEALTTVAVMTEDLFLRGSQPPLSLDRFPEFDPRRWYLLRPPTRTETWRAVTSYWTALMSITLPGRILNFYRAFEAVVGAQQGARQLREGLFSQVPSTSVRPVYAISTATFGFARGAATLSF
jgi:hypothetical protein